MGTKHRVHSQHRTSRIIAPQRVKGENKMQLVKFIDTVTEEPEYHFGLLSEDDTVFCFCCGNILEPGGYELLKVYPNSQLHYIEEYLKQDFKD